MNKIIVNQQQTKEIPLGRVVISLDDAYIHILGNRYDLNKDEYASIKAIVESKIVTRENYSDKDIKVYDDIVKTIEEPIGEK